MAKTEPQALGPSPSVAPSGKPKKGAEAGAEKPSSGEEDKKPSVEEAKKPGEKSSKPLTPAEIRSAVPAQKVENPKQALATAEIKSVWGASIGRVQSVDIAGGKLKGVNVSVGGKSVRIEPGQLKYVKSRNVLVTTLSKADVERLPAASKP